MNFETKNGLYLDLDCLYDTRLATLELLDERLAKIAIAEGYYKRTRDAFPFVDQKTFAEIYARRDTETLSKAMMTKALDVLANFTKDSVRRVGETPYQSEINVFLNVYPYAIDKPTAQAMLEPLAKLTGHVANINLLNLPIEKISLKFCRENLSLMMLYEFEQWLEFNTKNDMFRSYPVPDVCLFVPELFLTDKEISDDDIRMMVQQGAHPFRAVERMAKNLIDLTMLDIDYYCAQMPEPIIEEIKETYKTKSK